MLPRSLYKDKWLRCFELSLVCWSKIGAWSCLV